ncbi:MAG: hypothetical protein SBU_000248 [Candidatus Syntrophoarchaeum butanivorans]|uniref:Uncharacterized protein n=1 Tax=Candidatus Syntropharchaeum butanivorans TaxID=1839936 RepID=A0A1F2P744_9EURY|nr:MAG: hypothetical protein SBU_000248 [Candidatus Syntrophoarchaeum butanivorans]
MVGERRRYTIILYFRHLDIKVRGIEVISILPQRPIMFD